ncbi:MAG: asparagine synthase-related protein [Candidatus Thiodiazotropha weberae]|nr:asparagine synthase-related protein [Candidatus Thiodiazotropha lotti]MCW4208799.1 asparagine synthase-related protein [Candidatus Thiodiazotropha lotti]
MSLLIARLNKSELVIKGDVNYIANKDPYVSDNGSIKHTLIAGWSYDGQYLTVFSDRLGMIPIFYWQTKDEIYISNSILDIVSNIPNPTFDYDALSVFLRLGFYISNDTPINNVKVLSPDSTITISKSNFSLDTDTAEKSYFNKTFNGSRSQAISQYSSLFHEAVSERMPLGKFAMPLSGGRDSRHILLECLALKRKPKLVITSKKSSVTGQDEIDVASLLCEEFSLNHLVTEYDCKKTFYDEIIKNRLTHYLSDEHAWYLSIVDILRQEKVDYLLDGIGGDVLSNGLFYKPPLYEQINNNNTYAAAELILGKQNEIHYLSKTMQKMLSWERALEKIVNELEKHYGSCDPVKSFYFWNRTRREISLSPIYLLSKTVNVSMPYLAPDMLTFFFSLPSDEYGMPGFHDEVIAAHTTTCKTRYENKKKYNYNIEKYGSEWSAGIQYYMNTKFPPYVDKKYVLPRIIRLIITGNYSNESWYLKRLLYINELHKLGIKAT